MDVMEWKNVQKNQLTMGDREMRENQGREKKKR